GRAVVVDMADGDAPAIAGEVEPRAGTDVLEPTFLLLLKETVLGSGPWSAVVKQVDAKPAVAFQIDQGGPRTHALGHEIGAVDRARVVREIDPDLMCHVKATRGQEWDWCISGRSTYGESE